MSTAAGHLPYCPPGVSLLDPFIHDSFSPCFLGTLTTGTLWLYIVVFVLLDVCLSIISRNFSPYDESRAGSHVVVSCAADKSTDSDRIFLPCFLGTLTTGTLWLYGVVFVLLDVCLSIISRNFSPYDESRAESLFSDPSQSSFLSRLPSVAISLLIVFLGTLPILHAAISTLLLRVTPLYGHIILEAVGTSAAWAVCFVWFWWSKVAVRLRSTGPRSMFDGQLWRSSSVTGNDVIGADNHRGLFLVGFWMTAFVLAVIEVVDSAIKLSADDKTGGPLLALTVFKLAAVSATLALACVQPVASALKRRGSRYDKLPSRDVVKDADRDWEYVLTAASTSCDLDRLCEMFHLLPRECDRQVRFRIGKRYRNRPKNRYCNRLPYDDTRIVLRNCTSRTREGGDYINASPILLASALQQVADEGSNTFRAAAYIATQGPLPCTIEDFWRMIYEQKSRVVVMLSDLQEGAIVKCEKYWPEPNAPLYLPQYSLVIAQTGSVRCLRPSGNSRDIAYVKRTFRLQDTDKGTSFSLSQYQYVSPEWCPAASGTGSSSYGEFMTTIARKRPAENLHTSNDNSDYENLTRERHSRSLNISRSHLNEVLWTAADLNYHDRDFGKPSDQNLQCEFDTTTSSETADKHREALNEYVRFVLDADVSLSTAIKNSAGAGDPIGPVVVHCSAGTGRSGVHILVTECIRAMQRGATDVRPLNVLADMRRQRMGMIHTVDQFRFACEVVNEFMRQQANLV